MKSMKKKLTTLSALVASAAIAAPVLAGPGPGMPGLGQRAEDALEMNREDDRNQPYALTGDSNEIRPASRGPRLVQHYGRGGPRPDYDDDRSSTAY